MSIQRSDYLFILPILSGFNEPEFVYMLKHFEQRISVLGTLIKPCICAVE